MDELSIAALRTEVSNAIYNSSELVELRPETAAHRLEIVLDRKIPLASVSLAHLGFRELVRQELKKARNRFPSDEADLFGQYPIPSIVIIVDRTGQEIRKPRGELTCGELDLIVHNLESRQRAGTRLTEYQRIQAAISSVEKTPDTLVAEALGLASTTPTAI